MAKAYLELTEVVKLEEAAAYLRDRILIKLLFRLGCRVSEALGLKVEDIDFIDLPPVVVPVLTSLS